jgi:hypothetical protein
MELTDEVHWRELYGRGGTVTSDSMGRKRTGKWRIEKDQLCIEFDKDPPVYSILILLIMLAWMYVPA